MKKGKLESFGEVAPGEVISPLSYQLNGEGTPEHPCALLTEYPKEKPLMPIHNPADFAGVHLGEKE